MIQCNRHISFDVLLEGLFDYAGMFPPASRSFLDALRESAALPKTLQRPWILAADLVLDTAHTRRLAGEDLRALGFQRDISVCVLATEAPEEVSKVAQALRLSGSAEIGFRVASLEAQSPPADLNTLLTALSPAAGALSALIAIEPDLSTPSWRHTLEHTVAALRGRSPTIALKCRATGPTGIGPERLAAAIAAACDNRLGFKVTGGLHHPIVEPNVHEYPMGFLNVAAAVMLRRALGDAASEDALCRLLKNTSRSAITCLEGVHYDDLHISHAQLVEAKERAHFSIGSCSLHEPDADLLRLFA